MIRDLLGYLAVGVFVVGAVGGSLAMPAVPSAQRRSTEPGVQLAAGLLLVLIPAAGVLIAESAYGNSWRR